MTYILLILRHRGPCLVTCADSTAQYGSPMVAAKALSRGHFVRARSPWRHLAPPSLSLSASGAEPERVAAGPGSQKHFHSQFASPTHPGSAGALPPPRPALKPCGRGGIAAVADNTFLSWLSRRPRPLCRAFYRIELTVMPGPNWPKLTSCWCLH